MIRRFIKYFSLAAAVCFCHGAAAQSAPDALAGYRIVTWNIAKLSTPGRKMFGEETTPRSQEDIRNLGIVRDHIGADVYVLQEISSPAALAEVFPLRDFDLCLSGQWQADQLGLGPLYTKKQLTDNAIAPLCYTSETALADTPKPDDLLKQYVAIAIRKSSGIRIVAREDVPGLSVLVLDRRSRKAAFDDTVIRNLRWGLNLVLERAGRKTRLLAVHLKSGCTDRGISQRPIPFPDEFGAKAEEACAIVSRQLPHLKQWLDASVKDKIPFVIVGDLNRRLTKEISTVGNKENRFWSVLNGEATPSNSVDDVQISHMPAAEGDKCYAWDREDYRHPIDYFVFGGGHPGLAANQVTKYRFDQIKAGNGQPLAPADESDPSYPKGSEDEVKKQREAIADRLSDHCPRLAAIP